MTSFEKDFSQKAPTEISNPEKPNSRRAFLEKLLKVSVGVSVMTITPPLAFGETQEKKEDSPEKIAQEIDTLIASMNKRGKFLEGYVGNLETRCEKVEAFISANYYKEEGKKKLKEPLIQIESIGNFLFFKQQQEKRMSELKSLETLFQKFYSLVSKDWDKYNIGDNEDEKKKCISDRLKDLKHYKRWKQELKEQEVDWKKISGEVQTFLKTVGEWIEKIQTWLDEKTEADASKKGKFLEVSKNSREFYSNYLSTLKFLNENLSKLSEYLTDEKNMAEFESFEKTKKGNQVNILLQNIQNELKKIDTYWNMSF